MLLTSLPSGRAAVAYEVTTIPNVHVTDRNSYVSNPDGIISPEDAALMNAMAADLQKTMGIEMAVVAVESIGDNEPRMFATDLFKQWGLGQKGKDNGLLILLVTDPAKRAVVFETGYGLEGVLPDVICYRLQQRYMIPELKNGEYSRGMLRGVGAVREYLRASDSQRSVMTAGTETRQEEDSGMSVLLSLPVILLLFFLFRKNPAALAFILGTLLGGGRGGSGGGGSWGGGASGGGGSMSRF